MKLHHYSVDQTMSTAKYLSPLLIYHTYKPIESAIVHLNLLSKLARKIKKLDCEIREEVLRNAKRT